MSLISEQSLLLHLLLLDGEQSLLHHLLFLSTFLWLCQGVTSVIVSLHIDSVGFPLGVNQEVLCVELVLEEEVFVSPI